MQLHCNSFSRRRGY